MTTALLLLTLSCPAGVGPVPLTAVSVPLACGGWGNRGARPAATGFEAGPLGRFFGLFRRRPAAADCAYCTPDATPAASAPGPVAPQTASAPGVGPQPLPAGPAQPPEINAGEPLPQGLSYAGGN